MPTRCAAAAQQRRLAAQLQATGMESEEAQQTKGAEVRVSGQLKGSKVERVRAVDHVSRRCQYTQVGGRAAGWQE